MFDAGYADIMNRFASFTEQTLKERWAWRGQDLNVREALYRTLEEHQDALVRARTSSHPPEPTAILSLAQRTFGDLRGLLGGLPDSLLGMTPAPGEWSPRQILKHMIVTEQRYTIHTLYAAHRSDTDPLRVPADRLKAAEEVDDTGGFDDLLGRFERARGESNRLLRTLPSDALARPAGWMGYELDVRFRLHRFAAHISEHTIQCGKAIEALGYSQEEGRRIVRRIWAVRGELEVLAPDDMIRALDRQLAERAASL